MVKKIEILMLVIIKWRVKCYKVRFLDAKC